MVLEQQNRKGESAVALVQLALLFQHLQRDGGRRERQGEPDKKRLTRGKAEREAEHRKHDRGRSELRGAKPEDSRAHGKQPDRSQLEPYDEQQHDHAELAEL